MSHRLTAEETRNLLAVLRFSRELLQHSTNRHLYPSVAHMHALICVDQVEIVEIAAWLLSRSVRMSSLFSPMRA